MRTSDKIDDTTLRRQTTHLKYFEGHAIVIHSLSDRTRSKGSMKFLSL